MVSFRVKTGVLPRWNAENRRRGSGGDGLAPASSAGTSGGGGGGSGEGGSGGCGGGAAPEAAPGLPLATSQTPLQAPGLPLRADDEDADEGPDLWEDGHDKESLSALVQEHSDRIIQMKIKILGQRYTHFRRTRGHSSCFYRAFLFSYLENLGQLQDRQAEVTRLMQYVATAKDPFCGLIWDTATEHFSNPEEFFRTLKDEFNTMVDSVANGLLAETDIRTRGEEYKSLYPENFDVIPYCCKVVRPMNAQANVLAARALTYALGIPLCVEIVDEDLKDQIAKVKCLDFFPRSESGKGPYSVVMNKWSSSDRTPLLTLMCVHDPRHWYILYR